MFIELGGKVEASPLPLPPDIERKRLLMAKPDIKNGYLKIANELLDAIIIKINNIGWNKVLWYTIRITYGWNRKTIESNYGAYAKKTGLSKEVVKSIFWELSKRNIVFFVPVSPGKFAVEVNKDYEKWKVD